MSLSITRVMDTSFNFKEYEMKNLCGRNMGADSNSNIASFYSVGGLDNTSALTHRTPRISNYFITYG